MDEKPTSDMEKPEASQSTADKSLAVERARIVHSYLTKGDVSGLTPVQLTHLVVRMCEDMGLNPDTQPFQVLQQGSKHILYATRNATDQLARIHNVTRIIVDGPKLGKVGSVSAWYCKCRATLPNGRSEESTAWVVDADINSPMKCETKAKRRATLAILGLGISSEDELKP